MLGGLGDPSACLGSGMRLALDAEGMNEVGEPGTKEGLSGGGRPWGVGWDSLEG